MKGPFRKLQQLPIGPVRGLDLSTLWRGMTSREGGMADRIVPPTGHTATLTTFSAGVMAFLAVFALALALATGRLADRWAEGLAQTAIVRVTAPVEALEARTAATLEVLTTTPGVDAARALPGEARLTRNAAGGWDGSLVLTLPPR